MELEFKTQALAKHCTDEKTRRKKYGKIGGKRLGARLATLEAADSMQLIPHIPGNFHSLRADRKGSWSCNLEHPHRLIFEPANGELDAEGALILSSVTKVLITEIVDYHPRNQNH